MNLAVVLVVVFILAYVLIAMENRININKSSVALLLCCLMWSLLSLFSTSIDPSLDHARISSDLLGALGSTCEILVFPIPTAVSRSSPSISLPGRRPVCCGCWPPSLS